MTSKNTPSPLLSPSQKCRYRQLINSLRSGMPTEEIALLRAVVRQISEMGIPPEQMEKDDILSHALTTSQIVYDELGLGISSVVAALLHRFAEKEWISEEKLEKIAGPDVVNLIRGLAKIASVDTQTSLSQAETFRQLIISLATDVRVILIKLAERLYTMRTLDTMDPAIQLKTAWESFHLYAPLAHRLGLYNLKSDLEDLSMKYTEAENYSYIEQQLKDTARKRNKFIKEFIAPIEEELNKQGFDYEIKSRTKAIWSIWNKMKKQNVDFEEIYDVFAIRIILRSDLQTEKVDCWKVYSIVTDLYQPNPLRLRDWISVPKTNGYESLHTTVVVPGGTWVEVQIRTQRMDEIAEKGFAAHWKYKGVKDDKGLESWLAKVREVLESPDQDPATLLDEFRLNLYDKEVFVFTPKGDLKKFPKGSTVLDFAFDIHTAVGANCVGAKVNGKNVPIRYTLANGDKIEVLTSKNQKPKTDWLEFVITSKAKNRIRQSLKEEMLKEAENGKEILKRRFKNWKIEYSDENIRKLLVHYKLKSAVDLQYQIAIGKLDTAEIKGILVEPVSPPAAKPAEIPPASMESTVQTLISKSDDYLIIDEHVANVDYRLAKCCAPIFGDEIFGFVTINEGIKIHRINCPNARQLLERFHYRVVKARWAKSDGTAYFETVINVTGIDELGVVSRLSDLISKDLKVNMRSISIESDAGFYSGKLHVMVKDKSHLDVLIGRLLKLRGVLSATRQDAN